MALSGKMVPPAAIDVTGENTRLINASTRMMILFLLLYNPPSVCPETEIIEYKPPAMRFSAYIPIILTNRGIYNHILLFTRKWTQIGETVLCRSPACPVV